MLARDIALNARNVELTDLLAAIVNRIVKDINELLQIRTLVEGISKTTNRF